MRPKWYMIMILAVVLTASTIAVSLGNKETAPDQSMSPAGKPAPACNPACGEGQICRGGTCVDDKKNCNDNDPCTTDTWAKGRCQYVPMCIDDGNPCTDTCVDGVCNFPKDLGTTTCGVGMCKVTVDKCMDGQPQTCTPGTPSAEICDGLDNNCDGQIDDGFSMTGLDGNVFDGVGQACGAGVCAGGITSCSQDRTGIVCSTEIIASPETCDGLDNDCDGQVDEGNPGSGESCNTGLQE